MGPPTRPVCSGEKAYNKKLSHIMSTLLREVWRGEETTCENTEELLANIEEINNNRSERRGEIVVGSLDVKALYPSLDVDHAAEIVEKVLVESDLEFDGINNKELGLYLSLNYNEEELDTMNIKEYCPTRKKKKGKPKITGKAQSNDEEKRHENWNEAAEIPNKKTQKKMLAAAVKTSIKFIMKNHIYEFDNEMKKQERGGPIGLDITGEIACIYMTWWDKQLKEKMRASNIKLLLYKRYIDDIDMATETSKEDLNRYAAEDIDGERLQADAIIMKKVKEMGNEIHPSIQLETDYPSKNPDKKMPLLDVKIWTEKRSRQHGAEEETVILHEYYHKDVASKRVVHAKTAMSTKQKRTILTQEMLRILLRCSPLLPWKNTVQHINKFMLRMQYSGHKRRFRTQIIKSAMNAYNQIKDKDKARERPMYRKKEWKRKERRKGKRDQQRDWYKRGGYDTVVFVPCTPRSTLKQTYENIIRNTNIKMKVIEKRGQTLKDKLVNINRLKEKQCNDVENCLVCKTGNTGKCRTENITYKLTCDQCKDAYIGETSRNAYIRGKEHALQLQNKNKDSVMLRHQEQKHNINETPTFTMTVTGSYRNALDRQISEAVKINRQPRHTLINNKTEFRQNRIMRTKLLFE